MLGQAASFALYSILVRMKPQDLRPLTFLFSLFVLGLPFLLPGLVWELSVAKTMVFSPAILGAIVISGRRPVAPGIPLLERICCNLLAPAEPHWSRIVCLCSAEAKPCYY